jgi:hypothetical protein
MRLFFFILLLLIPAFSCSQKAVRLIINLGETKQKVLTYKPIHYKVRINDTLTLEKITDSFRVEFNIPKYLLKDSILDIEVRSVNNRIITGSLCEFYLVSSMSIAFEPYPLYRDSLINNSEYWYNMQPAITTGCGSLGSFKFKINSSNLEDVTYEDKPISYYDKRPDMYCLIDILKMLNDTITIEGRAGVLEINPISLAKQRAETVKKVLEDFGFPKSKIRIKTIDNEFIVRLKEEYKKEKLKKNALSIVDGLNYVVFFCGR